eukprot:CAMPEP_0116895718 /NCGR_PEP_ID=MMETSP0467-20121206/5162_1 /TAXON_ID=283647 /ORGANISM="Mesodinium pulex, Strain SPMC105" /LENGTH=39 /DNA_ID= /DNA_START= /DNA_END= /DNA_ORIENTATION=
MIRKLFQGEDEEFLIKKKTIVAADYVFSALALPFCILMT